MEEANGILFSDKKQRMGETDPKICVKTKKERKRKEEEDRKRKIEVKRKRRKTKTETHHQEKGRDIAEKVNEN